MSQFDEGLLKSKDFDEEFDTPEKKRPREDLEGRTPGGGSVASTATEVVEEAAEQPGELLDDTAS